MNRTTNVALMRGLNLGSSNRMTMTDLSQLFVEAGCTDVRTYIQSGNVIFQASPSKLEKLPALIAKSIADRFGFKVPVVLRTVEQLGETVQNNPFLKAGVEEATLHVYFLAGVPDARNISGLDPKRSLPDAFFVRGRDVYVQLPNGMARTKLSNAYFDSKLATISTARNWRTVLKLFELMQA
jgi:uncharacterized protein (DUF1697 family)